LSYNSKGGHGYGNQRRHGSSSYYHVNKNQNQRDQQLSNRNLLPINITKNQTAHFSIFIRAPETWDKTSWTVELQPYPDIMKQAYELSALANQRKIEIILNSPNNQPIKKYRLEKKQVEIEPNKETEQINTTVVPGYLSSLKAHLESFGYSMVEVKL